MKNSRHAAVYGPGIAGFGGGVIDEIKNVEHSRPNSLPTERLFLISPGYSSGLSVFQMSRWMSHLPSIWIETFSHFPLWMTLPSASINA